MTYENCKLGAVQSQDGGWGFNVLRERGGPVVTLIYGNYPPSCHEARSLNPWATWIALICSNSAKSS